MLYLESLNPRRRTKSNYWIAYLFLLVILALVVLMSSCATQKRCNEKYPPQVSDSTYTKDSIVFVPDTIIVPGETVVITDTIPCPDVVYHKEVKKNHSTAIVDINKGKLTVECKTDSLEKIIIKQNHIIETNRNRKEVSKPVIEYRTRFIDMLCRWIAGIAVGALLILIARKRLSVVRKE